MPSKALYNQLQRTTKEPPTDTRSFVYVIAQTERDLFSRPTQGQRTFYTGVTTNLKRRLRQHNQGKTTSTRGIEWELVAFMGGFTNSQAYVVEKFLKRGDTIKKRDEFRIWCVRVRTDEKCAQDYWRHIYPRLRNLAWFDREVI